MKHLITLGLGLCLLSCHAVAETTQTFDASVQNTQQICGINYANSKTSGDILTRGESGTDTGKAIAFVIRANTKVVTWKITEANIVENAEQFTFASNLLNVTDRNVTSVYVNNVEYDWGQAQLENRLTPNNGDLKIAPKINLDATEFPLGNTKISGKVVITCGN